MISVLIWCINKNDSLGNNLITTKHIARQGPFENINATADFSKYPICHWISEPDKGLGWFSVLCLGGICENLTVNRSSSQCQEHRGESFVMLSHWKEMETQMTSATRRKQVQDGQVQHNNSQLLGTSESKQVREWLANRHWSIIWQTQEWETIK